MLTIKFNVNPATIEAMRTKGSRIVQVLSVKLTAIVTQLASFVQAQKLSGQVLKVQTGKLRASVHPIPTTIDGTKLTAYVEAGVPPSASRGVNYGAVHEYGGSRAYQILATKARALSFITNGKRVFAASVSRKPAIARPFLSTSLAENKDKIVSELNSAVAKVVNEP